MMNLAVSKQFYYYFLIGMLESNHSDILKMAKVEHTKLIVCQLNEPLFWFIRKDEKILQSDQILQSRKPTTESGNLDKEYGNWKCVKGLVKKKKEQKK